MKKIVLYGAGGLAREIANMIEIINAIEIKKGNMGKYDLLGFLVIMSRLELILMVIKY